jgi:hypothetical protein
MFGHGRPLVGIPRWEFGYFLDFKCLFRNLMCRHNLHANKNSQGISSMAVCLVQVEL